MKKILTLSFLILGLQNLSAKDYFVYYHEINKAELAHLDKDFEKSDSIYQVAFGLVEKPFKDDLLLASINSEQLNNDKKTYEYLKKGVSVGLTLSQIKKKLSSFKKASEWKLLKKEYKKIRQNYLSTLNLSLREELLQIIKKDQAIRHPIFGNSKKMGKVDADNYQKLLAIIEKNRGKWPGRFLIGDGNEGGKYAFGEITIMLHHQGNEKVDALKQVLLEAIKNGSLSPYNVAYPWDYSHVEVLGTKWVNKKKTKGYAEICLPLGGYTTFYGGDTVIICDCEKANEERKKMGLEPLEDYYRKRNVKYKCNK